MCLSAATERYQLRAVGNGGQGEGAIDPPPDFGRSVNPTEISRAEYVHHLPLQIFRFSDGSGHSSLLDVVVTKMIISEDYDGCTVDNF
jgi:hypothetical protein